MTDAKSILVVGDLMIDRNWVVPRASAVATSQAHADVAPRKLISPTWQTAVLGGAGVVARAAVAAAISAKSDSKIYLAGAWEDGFKPADFIPYDERKLIPKGKIEFIQAAKTTFNTEKTRVYEQRSTGDTLVERYDRDLFWNREIYTFNLEAEWPKSGDVAVVIVTDFRKGLLDLKKVRDKLKDYDNRPFLLRAKRKAREAVFAGLPWTLALPNRDDLGGLFEAEPVEPPSLREVEEKSRPLCELNPKLAESIMRFFQRFPTDSKHPQRSVLVKLDREGALLCERIASRVKCTAMMLPANEKKLAGIGAGDVLAANLAVSLVKRRVSGPSDSYLRAFREAVPAATAFCQGATKISHPDGAGDSQRGWFGVAVSTEPKNVQKVEARFTRLAVKPPSTSVGILVSRNEQTRRCRRVLQAAKPISIKHGSWFLEDFLTVDKDLGDEILGLKSRIRAYFEAPERNAKPFVTALCGEPGSGKSALADALAKALDCDVVRANAAQWTSADDLFRLCEEIRTIRVKEGKPFVFIDEVDAPVRGEMLYGKLLAPLGEAAYTSLGYTRQLGPVAFLLAGSNEPWTTGQKLLIAPLKKNCPPKLNDLVSRFSSPPITVPVLAARRLDALYLAASFLHDRYPGTKKVERGVLKLLCESTPKHGPRSIKEVVRMFGALKDQSCVTADDLKKNAQECVELHLGPLPPKWRKDQTRIEIRL